MRKCNILNSVIDNVFVLFFCYLSLIYMIDRCCMWNGMMVVFFGMWIFFGILVYFYINDLFVLIVVLIIDINVSCRICVLIFKKNKIKG